MKDLEGPTMSADLGVGGAAYSFGGLGAKLFENIESYPGQVYVTPSLMSPNEELAASRSHAVRAARQVERMSPHIRAGIDKKTNMVVGSHLRVSATPDWRQFGMTREQGVAWTREWSRKAESLFHSWAYDRRKLCDGEGHDTFGGMMQMAFRNLTGPDGEFAMVIQYDKQRARRYGTPWGTFINVIDPQRISTPFDADWANNPNVFDGRLLDANGRMIGFWVEKPTSEKLFSPVQHVFVPRETKTGRPMGVHWFAKHRGAAQRGITQMVNTLKRQQMLDRFDSATLGAAVVAAAMATYIKTKKSAEAVAADLAPGSAAPDPGGLIAKPDFYKKLNLRIGGNRIPVLDTDDEIEIAAANRQTRDPTSFRNGYLREFAAVLGIDFEQFSGNYSETNYSSARSALVNIWRGIISERNQFCYAGPALCYDAVLEEAIVTGRLPLAPGHTIDDFYLYREAYTRCQWTGPGMGWVDPKKEAEAVQLRLDPTMPVSTLAIEAGNQGLTADELIEQRADEMELMKEAGLIQDPPPQPSPAANQPPANEPPERREEPED